MAKLSSGSDAVISTGTVFNFAALVTLANLVLLFFFDDQKIFLDSWGKIDYTKCGNNSMFAKLSGRKLLEVENGFDQGKP
jgi:hypothetical protein